GRRVVGDEGGYAARGRGFTAARQRVPALRVRPVVGGLAGESGGRRGDRGSLRRRLGGGVRASGGSRAVSESVSGTAGEVWARTSCREDAADRVRQVRPEEPASAGRR